MFKKKFVGVLCLAVVLAFFSLGFKKGEMVLAPWGNSYYQATIAQIVGDSAKVNYVDGDKGTVKLSAIKPIAKPAKVTVGLVCLAQWTSHSYYKAKVIKVAGDDVTVEFLDDHSTHTVKKHKVFKF